MAGSRETTPEQFEGMNDGQSHFRDVAESSEGDDSTDDGPRKRTKVKAADASAVPKWSNPDPYTVLPPPETLGAPKKDIVQTIRKAKNEQASKVDKVADNSDFISFNFGDDDEEDAATDPPSPPVAKSPAHSGAPTFSHRDSFHRKTSTASAPQTNGATVSPFTSANKRQQAPISISSDAEHTDPTPSFVAETISRPPKRKARHNMQMGDVTEDWQVKDGQPVAPWCTTDHSETTDIGLRYVRPVSIFSYP
jgi:non-canonical poly(A) RNA polymerase PAPD5/7